VSRRLWLVLALVVAGCGTGGAWSKDGFSQTTYGWKASYPAGKTTLLGDDWRVDNWERPSYATDGSDAVAGEKTGPGFTIDFAEDGNGDGKIDANESGRRCGRRRAAAVNIAAAH
jgi:hypothetical protein